MANGGVLSLRSSSCGLAYLLSAPDTAELLPVVVFLHGAGESGAGDAWGLLPGYDAALGVWRSGQPQPVRYTPPGLAVDNSPLVQRVVLICPRTDRGWGTASSIAVVALLDEVLALAPCADARRVVLSGISMGGAGAWALGAQQPQRWAGVAPLCGFAGSAADRHTIARALSGTAVYAVHGHNDVVIPFEETRDMVARLAREGNRALTYFECKGVAPHGHDSMLGHDCWTRTYGTADFWEWVRGLPPVGARVDH
jgi:predicted peptidase